jgi:hypothetical protein
VNRGPRRNVVKFQRLVVGELLARMNELDLIDLDALLFLQRLFDRQYLILGFKIERLLASRKSLDENLSTVVSKEARPTAKERQQTQ